MKKNCLNCNIEYNARRSVYKYCSNSCQADFQYKQYISEWLDGNQTGNKGEKSLQLSDHVRRYLHDINGTACSKCGWDEKHPVDGRTLTEVDHIDGNASNSTLNNLRILCPNCHSMTTTFRARNKQSSRER